MPDQLSFAKMAQQAEDWVADEKHCEFPYLYLGNGVSTMTIERVPGELRSRREAR